MLLQKLHCTALIIVFSLPFFTAHDTPVIKKTYVIDDMTVYATPDCWQKDGEPGVCLSLSYCFGETVISAIREMRRLYWNDVSKCAYASGDGVLFQGACCRKSLSSHVYFTVLPHGDSSGSSFLTSRISEKDSLPVSSLSQWPLVSQTSFSSPSGGDSHPASLRNLTIPVRPLDQSPAIVKVSQGESKTGILPVFENVHRSQFQIPPRIPLMPSSHTGANEGVSDFEPHTEYEEAKTKVRFRTQFPKPGPLQQQRIGHGNPPQQSQVFTGIRAQQLETQTSANGPKPEQESGYVPRRPVQDNREHDGQQSGPQIQTDQGTLQIPQQSYPEISFHSQLPVLVDPSRFEPQSPHEFEAQSQHTIISEQSHLTELETQFRHPGYGQQSQQSGYGIQSQQTEFQTMNQHFDADPSFQKSGIPALQPQVSVSFSKFQSPKLPISHRFDASIQPVDHSFNVQFQRPISGIHSYQPEVLGGNKSEVGTGTYYSPLIGTSGFYLPNDFGLQFYPGFGTPRFPGFPRPARPIHYPGFGVVPHHPEIIASDPHPTDTDESETDSENDESDDGNNQDDNNPDDNNPDEFESDTDESGNDPQSGLDGKLPGDDSTGTNVTPQGPPWILGVNWPPPIPTHPPDHTVPNIPTHPPTEGYPAFTNPTTPAIPTWPAWPTWTPWTLFPPTATTPSPIDLQTTTPSPTGPGISIGGCGQKKTLGFRVVGGIPAEKHEWRWMAGLFRRGRLFCGGSLIDNYHVLTAAHCVKGVPASALTINLGDHDISASSDAIHLSVKVSVITVHPSYNEVTNHNDIAIIRLSSRVTYTDHIVPICLPSPMDFSDFSGETGTVAGWGSLHFGLPVSNVLYEVELNIWKNSDCAAAYQSMFPGQIISSFMCAGGRSKDSCTGDSGGPMQIFKNGRWIQIGIVSWGIRCGATDKPGVYTRVSSFLDWIKSNSN